eukprot:scaffold3516_cov118-Pinguiococcus_pyrenoidosus.AAC.1
MSSGNPPPPTTTTKKQKRVHLSLGDKHDVLLWCDAEDKQRPAARPPRLCIGSIDHMIDHPRDYLVI